MPRQGLTVLAILAAPLFLSGCGTMANVAYFYPEEGGKRVYGGLRGDCEALQSLTTSTSADAPKGGELAFHVLKYSVDLPFSAVADTVTLPITIPWSLWYQATHPEPIGDGPETLPVQDRMVPREEPQERKARQQPRPVRQTEATEDD